MSIRAFALVTLAVVLPRLASEVARAETCEATFESITMNRQMPHSFVDQGLASLPQVFPAHTLILQRRSSLIGEVTYSLLVYKPNSAADVVVVEGVAVSQGKAWRFAATCTSSEVMIGLVTTLERVAALAKLPSDMANPVLQPTPQSRRG
jgi:hypothetical protein